MYNEDERRPGRFWNAGRERGYQGFAVVSGDLSEAVVVGVYKLHFACAFNNTARFKL